MLLPQSFEPPKKQENKKKKKSKTSFSSQKADRTCRSTTNACEATPGREVSEIKCMYGLSCHNDSETQWAVGYNVAHNSFLKLHCSSTSALCCSAGASVCVCVFVCVCVCVCVRASRACVCVCAKGGRIFHQQLKSHFLKVQTSSAIIDRSSHETKLNKAKTTKRIRGDGERPRPKQAAKSVIQFCRKKHRKHLLGRKSPGTTRSSEESVRERVRARVHEFMSESMSE